MKDIVLKDLAIVVLAESNNPRLLNHDFLDRNKIIPTGWEPTNVLVTPPLANVRYDNGINILAEENKLQFQATKADDIEYILVEVPQIAIKYLQTLHHVSYTAVGLNFTFFSDDISGTEAEKCLIDKLLRSGPWKDFRQGLTGIVVELQYRKSFPYMSVKVGVRENPGGTLEGFIIKANFHYPFKSSESKEREAFITSIKKCYTEIIDYLEQLDL